VLCTGSAPPPLVRWAFYFPLGGLVKAAAFLNPGAIPLNELSVVMDVRPVREQKVCCALVQHKPKEGSLWWKICGGTGAHTHQGLTFCGRHTSPAVPSTSVRRRRQTTGKVPVFTTDTVACSSEHGLRFFKCLGRLTRARWVPPVGVEIQPVGQNWRSDPQWSRAVAPGKGP
jgi:hypothetical protein